MGISTISSYRGSQLFEIVGLDKDVVDLCFTNTTSRVKGKNFKNLDAQLRSIDDYARSNLSDMNVGGLLKYIHGGEYHAYNPEIVKKLQEANITKLKDAPSELMKIARKGAGGTTKTAASFADIGKKELGLGALGAFGAGSSLMDYTPSREELEQQEDPYDPYNL